MKWLYMGCALLVFAGGCNGPGPEDAQTAMPDVQSAKSAPTSGMPPRTDALIVHPSDYPILQVHSWERNGKFFSAFPGDPTEVPYDAAEINVRPYYFPEGSVREITMKAGTRTHPNSAHEDILFYQVSGRRVQVINDDSFQINPGDASLQIAGVRKRMDQLIEGVFVEFAVVRPATPGAEGMMIKAADAVETAVAEWSEGGKTVVRREANASSAPRTASRYTVRSFAFPNHELTEVRLPKGATMASQTSDDIRYFYVVSGQLRATIGDTQDIAEARAAMRAPAGVGHGFEALEDTVLLYAPIPPAAS